jgi:hypothetical protein
MPRWGSPRPRFGARITGQWMRRHAYRQRSYTPPVIGANEPRSAWPKHSAVDGVHAAQIWPICAPVVSRHEVQPYIFVALRRVAIPFEATYPGLRYQRISRWLMQGS